MRFQTTTAFDPDVATLSAFLGSSVVRLVVEVGRKVGSTYYGNFLLEVIQVLASLLLGRLLLVLVLRGGHAVAVRPSIL